MARPVWTAQCTAGRLVRELLPVRRRESHKGDYGRCVYHCNSDVVDNQVLTMQMADGSLITLCMDIFTQRDRRTTDIKMTEGEIVSDGKKIYITEFAKRKTDIIDFTEIAKQPFHSGADLKLVENFLNAIRGEGDTLAGTTIGESLKSHLLCFEAERSRHTGRTIDL